jgi:uncharacterized membrane protein
VIGMLWALGTFAAWLVCSGIALVMWRFVIDPLLFKLGHWYWI